MNTTIELTPKQAEYIREAHHRWNFSIGAVRSGKSYLALQYIIPNCLVENKDKRGLNVILGATQGNIKRNVLEPMRDIWGSELVSQLSTDNTCKIFGEKVYCIGAETRRAAARVRGSEIKFCYCDEVVDVHEDAFEMLKSRLSLPYSQCHAAANPSYPTHFIKQFLDSADKGVDIYCQQNTIYDNPFLPPEYVRALELEYTGTVYYDRYILGKWTKAEGLVFPMYTEALGTIPGQSEKTAFSLDYGTQNPFACIQWDLCGGIWYATRGYYYDGRSRGIQKTDSEYAEDIEAFAAATIQQREIRERKTGITQPKLELIIDPSAASFITLMRKKSWCKVIPADNDVQNGIRETASAMHSGLIKINPEMKEWIEEVNSYIWDDRQDEDRVVKEHDHYMDATRYFVKTKRIVKPKSKFKSIWE